MTVPTRLVAEAAQTYVVHSRAALALVPIPDEPGTIVVNFFPDRAPPAPDTAAAFRAALDDAVRRGQPKWLEVLNLEGGVVTASQMGELLGISRQAVDKRRRAGSLLGFRDGGRDYLYPVWQIRGRKPLPGLDRVLSALREGDHDPLSQFIFFLSSFPRLWDERPLDYLRRGGALEIDEVEHAALGYLEQGAA